MSQIKDNLLIYKHSISSLFRVLRVVCFEKFSLVFLFFYLVFFLSLSFVLSVFHWTVSLLILVLAGLFFTKVLSKATFIKKAFIRKDDRVEYADPNAKNTDDIFKTAKILLKMTKKEAKKSSLISDDFIFEDSSFYLVEENKKTKLIAFDWIVGISIAELE